MNAKARKFTFETDSNDEINVYCPKSPSDVTYLIEVVDHGSIYLWSGDELGDPRGFPIHWDNYELLEEDDVPRQLAQIILEEL